MSNIGSIVQNVYIMDSAKQQQFYIQGANPKDQAHFAFVPQLYSHNGQLYQQAPIPP